MKESSMMLICGGFNLVRKGWHLPSDQEWIVLEKTLGMNEDDLNKMLPGYNRESGLVGHKLKSKIGWQLDYGHIL